VEKARGRYSLGVLALVAGLATTGCGGEPDTATDEGYAKALPEGAVRVATFNASLNRAALGELAGDLSTPDNAQARAIAEIIQRVRPDILLLNELDYDAEGESARLFQDNYLGVSQHKQRRIEFEYRYVAASNTGVASGKDLDNDGKVGGGNDAYGFGEFEGQYAFVVYSKYPIAEDDIRTFQRFLWKDMPGATFPDNPKTSKKGDWYTSAELDVLRLSSKNHVDVPVDVDGHRVHLLAHHPTPPAFDGPEDRNGIRNHHEIRLFADYITPGAGDYLVDDQGRAGGLGEDESFVILGDHNSDPEDGSSQAIRQLLEHPRVDVSMTPRSSGGPSDAKAQGGINLEQQGDPAFDTGDFNDAHVGNLRLDYVLPSRDLEMLDARIYWPRSSTSTYPLILNTDHRLVWIDVQVK
jgi:3-phytase